MSNFDDSNFFYGDFPPSEQLPPDQILYMQKKRADQILHMQKQQGEHRDMMKVFRRKEMIMRFSTSIICFCVIFVGSYYLLCSIGINVKLWQTFVALLVLVCLRLLFIRNAMDHFLYKNSFPNNSIGIANTIQ